MWEKNKETTKYDKSIIICDIGTIQYGNETVKWRKKKKKEPPNVTKVLSNMMLVLPNVIMEPLNVRRKKKSPNETKE